MSVATLWRTPGIARAIDAPALGNPVDLDRWNRNLATTRARAWLEGRVVTQALYGEQMKVLAIRGRWAKVAVRDQPTPLWDVFRAHGVTVPRDTGPQSRGGKRVRGTALRPGDLVFYGSPATHVAIVVGRQTMIESPDSAHAVRVVPLRRGFTAVRRYTRG